MQEKINYQKICSDLIKGLPQRTADVVERRFGLKTGERETLESIGQSYEITRERVRQIEAEGFGHIFSAAEKYQEVFDYFKKKVESFGGLKREDKLLESLGGEKFKNHVFFLLVISKILKRFPETEKYHSFWAADEKIAQDCLKTTDNVVNMLEKEGNPVNPDRLHEMACAESKCGDRESFLSCVEVSSRIQQNPEGLFGLSNWVEINPKGIKDKAYLVLKKSESPLHFTQVAFQIQRLPVNKEKKVHVATVHNELIKDSRFVLVGRGLYALAEWGYKPGVVKEVIAQVIKEAKRPLTKEEIAEKVLSQRFVKENTILLNLQDKDYFARDDEGRYNVREA